MKLSIIVAIAAAACCHAGGAGAQTIYRCGNEYTRIPCPQGKAIETLDARTAAHRAEAQRLAAEEKRLGAEMERDRRRHEAALKPAGAARLGAAPASAAASAPKKAAAKKRRPTLQAADPDRDFVAAVPGSGKKATARR